MDERQWTDRPLSPGELIKGPDWDVRLVEVGVQSLISGDLDAALAFLAPGVPVLGLAEGPAPGDHAIRIARDHALLITSAPPGATPGWLGDGFAFSAAGDRYACLALEGPGARHLLAHGLASPLPMASPSAAIGFAGITALLTAAPAGLFLWVERARLTEVSGALARVTSRPTTQVAVG